MDHTSNNHQQPLWFRRKAKRLLDPLGPRIPRPDPISQDLTPKKVRSETPPLRRSQIVTTAVPSTTEPINVFPSLCSTSPLRMSTALLTTSSHWRSGDAELPPPPRRYALSKAPTPLVVDSSHDVGPCTDLYREEQLLDGHDWQAQRIIGERQTPSGLEYEVSAAKTLWLPRTTFNTKLVQRYNAEQRAATTVRMR